MHYIERVQSCALEQQEAFMAKGMNWQKVGKQEQIRRNGHQFKKDNSRHFHWPRGSIRSAQKCTAQRNSSWHHPGANEMLSPPGYVYVEMLRTDRETNGGDQ